MRKSYFQPVAFARSYVCIGIGIVVEAIALSTMYVALFDRPPLCEMLCELITLVPIMTCALSSTWLGAWHFPNWQQTSRPKRACILAIMILSLGQIVWLFNL